MIIYKRKFLHSDWLKTCQLIPDQWNFISATLNHIRFVFSFITLWKITKEIFAKICWQSKTPTRTWKCTRCIMKMSYLYASDFPFKNFCKIAQHTETIRKNVWEKSNDVYSLSIRIQTTMNHISIFTFLCFYDNINVKENVFFQRVSWERYCATHWREQRGWDLVIFDWFVLSMRMQVIVDSSFAHPGSAPIWGEKRGEFRDWTTVHIACHVWTWCNIIKQFFSTCYLTFFPFYAMRLW